MHFGSPARLLLCLCLLVLAGIAPPLAAGGAATNELVPAADGWVNSARSSKNHGAESVLKNYGGVWETYIMFDLTAWRDRRFGALRLELSAVAGDGSSLSVASTATDWQETTLNYKRRPCRCPRPPPRPNQVPRECPSTLPSSSQLELSTPTQSRCG